MASRWTSVLLVLVLVAVSGATSSVSGESVRARQERAASFQPSTPIKSLKRLEKPHHDARKLATWNLHGAPAGEAFVLEDRSRCVIVTTESPSRESATAARPPRTARGPPHA